MQHLRPKVVKAVASSCHMIGHTLIVSARMPASNPDTRPPQKSNPIEEQPTNVVAANLKQAATVIRFRTGLDGRVQYVQGYPPDHPSRVRCFPLARQSRKLL